MLKPVGGNRLNDPGITSCSPHIDRGCLSESVAHAARRTSGHDPHRVPLPVITAQGIEGTPHGARDSNGTRGFALAEERQLIGAIVASYRVFPSQACKLRHAGAGGVRRTGRREALVNVGVDGTEACKATVEALFDVLPAIAVRSCMRWHLWLRVDDRWKGQRTLELSDAQIG